MSVSGLLNVSSSAILLVKHNYAIGTLKFRLLNYSGIGSNLFYLTVGVLRVFPPGGWLRGVVPPPWDLGFCFVAGAEILTTSSGPQFIVKYAISWSYHVSSKF